MLARGEIRTIDFENRLPHGHSRFVSRPVPEYALILIRLRMKNRGLAVPSIESVLGFEVPVKYCKCVENIPGVALPPPGGVVALKIRASPRPPYSFFRFIDSLCLHLHLP